MSSAKLKVIRADRPEISMQYTSQMVSKICYQYQNLVSRIKYQNFDFVSITYHNFFFSVSQIQPHKNYRNFGIKVSQF